MKNSKDLFKKHLDNAASKIELNTQTMTDINKIKGSFKEEKIKGGLADNKSLYDIAKKHYPELDRTGINKRMAKLKTELSKGIRVEMEHTKDEEVAKEIALDHLYEDPKYYTKLKKIEENSNRNKRKKNINTEGKELDKMGIKNFRDLFDKMPSDLQKRVYNLKNFGQRPDKHPEGNVLKHTIMVVNRSLKDDDIDIALAAMFHDIGKDETANIHPKKGYITHFGHEKVSANLVKKYGDWIESIGGNPDTVFFIVKNHMKYKRISDMNPKKQSHFKSEPNFDKVSKFSKHDKGGLDISSDNKIENKEATSSASSGSYSQPLFGGESTFIKKSKSETPKLKEDTDKVEAKEATTTASSGSYETPAMWAKSTSKKHWGPSRKPQIPGGSFVSIKKKCKKFPYCNQGDIKALNIYKNKTVKEVINKVSSNYNLSENTVKAILEYELELRKNKKMGK